MGRQGEIVGAPTNPRRSRLASDSRPDLAELIAIGALTAAVLVLRFSQIHQSLLGDEVFTYHDVVGHSFSSLLTGVYTGGENSPPLYFLLAWLSAKLGDPTVWIRLPSILLGAATVPTIYMLGRETVGRGAGLIGAAVVALSPFSLYYGVEARPYATMAFFVVLSTLALLKALDTHSPAWWVVYALAGAAAAYSHYTSVFVLGVQAAWSLWARRERLREPLLANLLMVLLYVPWLPHVRGKSLVTFQRFEPLSASNIATDLMRTIPGYPYATLRAIPTILGLVAIGICLLLGIAVAVWRRSRERHWTQDPSHLPLLVALALATPIGLFLYSVLVTDLWLARGLYASVPAAALVLGALLIRLPRPLAVVSVTVVLLTLVVGAIRAVSPNHVRTPFRSIAAYLDQNAGPGDPIIYGTIVGAPAISAQMGKPHQVLSSALGLHGSARAGERAFVVEDDDLASELHVVGPPALPHFRAVLKKHYPGIFPTDVWIYRPA